MMDLFSSLLTAGQIFLSIIMCLPQHTFSPLLTLLLAALLFMPNKWQKHLCMKISQVCWSHFLKKSKDSRLLNKYYFFPPRVKVPRQNEADYNIPQLSKMYVSVGLCSVESCG